MDTANLSPDTPVPVGGVYYCCMCKHGDPMLKNALSGYAKEKGVDSDAVFAAMGMGADQPITRKRFVMGDKFGVCPRHQKATGWSLEREEAAAPTSSRATDKEAEFSRAAALREVHVVRPAKKWWQFWK